LKSSHLTTLSESGFTGFQDDQDYTQHRHKLRFCKTILQIVLSAKRFAKHSENADYDGGKNISLCFPYCKRLLYKKNAPADFRQQEHFFFKINGLVF